MNAGNPAGSPPVNPFAAAFDAMQTLASTNMGQQPFTMPAMTPMSTMPKAEAGWWWLGAVKPEAWQAALNKWFSPTTDIAPLVASDRRFRSPSWQAQPFFQATRDQYLRTAAFWREVVTHADLDERERHRAKFFLEQMLDASAPSNFFMTNPEAIERAIETKGESLKHGLENLQACHPAAYHR